MSPQYDFCPTQAFVGARGQPTEMHKVHEDVQLTIPVRRSAPRKTPLLTHFRHQPGHVCCLALQARAFMGALKPTYWQALIVVCVIYFTRFDWSFVILRAKQVRLREAGNTKINS